MVGRRPDFTRFSEGFRMPQLAKRRPADDEVIDLTERLAPYQDSALRPIEPKAPAPTVVAEPSVWKPLEFDIAFQTVGQAAWVEDHPEALEATVDGAVRVAPAGSEPPVAAMVAMARLKQSRNEACGCGSGREFKRCCGPRGDEALPTG